MRIIIGFGLLFIFNTFNSSFAIEFTNVDCHFSRKKVDLFLNLNSRRCSFNFDPYALDLNSNGSLVLKNVHGGKGGARNLNAHDGYSITEDGKRILVTHGEVLPGDLCKARYDILSVLDTKTGRTIKSFSFYNQRKKIFWDNLDTPLIHREGNGKGPWYDCAFFLKAGSFYEIPNNENSKKVTSMRKGNYLVSIDGGARLMILDNRLKKIELDIRLEDRVNGVLKNAQVLKNGKIVFSILSSEEGKEASIGLLNPATNKVKILFPKGLEDSTRSVKIKFKEYHLAFSLLSDEKIQTRDGRYYGLKITGLHTVNNVIYIQFNKDQNYIMDLMGNLKWVSCDQGVHGPLRGEYLTSLLCRLLI